MGEVRFVDWAKAGGHHIVVSAPHLRLASSVAGAEAEGQEQEAWVWRGEDPSAHISQRPARPEGQRTWAEQAREASLEVVSARG